MVLITRRSRVRIPPPLSPKAPHGGAFSRSGASWRRGTEVHPRLTRRAKAYRSGWRSNPIGTERCGALERSNDGVAVISVSLSVGVGLFCALLSALGTNLAFLFKQRGAVAAPDVEMRHPVRSAVALFR